MNTIETLYEFRLKKFVLCSYMTAKCEINLFMQKSDTWQFGLIYIKYDITAISDSAVVSVRFFSLQYCTQKIFWKIFQICKHLLL